MKKILICIILLSCTGCVSTHRYKRDLITSYYIGRVEENKFAVDTVSKLKGEEDLLSVLMGSRVSMEMQMILLGIDYKAIEDNGRNADVRERLNRLSKGL